MNPITHSPTSPTRVQLARNGGLLALGAIAIFGAAACNSIFTAVDGSGVPETATYEFAGTGESAVDEIEVESTFEVEITVEDGPATVEVTVDDNLIEHLDVTVDDDRLTIGFQNGSYDVDVKPTAVVTVPALTMLDVSGASSADVTGLDGESLDLSLSGASHARVDGSTDRLVIDASDASNTTVTGSTGRLDLDASGASVVDLAELSADSGVVDLSGASGATLGPIGEVEGDLSGASTLSASTSSDVHVSTSGASAVEWR